MESTTMDMEMIGRAIRVSCLLYIQRTTSLKKCPKLEVAQRHLCVPFCSKLSIVEWEKIKLGIERPEYI